MTTKPLQEVLPPPLERYSILGWLHKNLFSTWYNTLLTFVSLILIYLAMQSFLTWAFTQARWESISTNLKLFMVGRYPNEQLWRVWLSVILFSAVLGQTIGAWARTLWKKVIWIFMILILLAPLPFDNSTRLNLAILGAIGAAGVFMGHRLENTIRRTTLFTWLAYLLIFFMLLSGLTGEGGFLPKIDINIWGGLLITVILAVVGIIFSLPLGILLALGRRSKFPAMRWFSTIYIEVIRGVPLVTILFMADLMLPLFLPGDIRIERVIRAMVGITLFNSAYMAENIRGGLQSIPKGQYQAADALGLNYFQSMLFIVLPQALRTVIPVIMSQFIGILKDTTLIAIIGLLDILGIANSILAQPKFLGVQMEVYLFVAFVFFIMTYLLSYLSERIEDALGVGRQ